MPGPQASIRGLDPNASLAHPCGILPWFRVGRSQDCHLIANEAHVSHDHATIRHTGGGAWVLRDLGSKNGTFLNRRRLAAGDVKLSEGDVLWFGDERTAWVFSPGAPSAMIVVGGGRSDWLAVAEDERLVALPSAELAQATLLHRGSEWVLEAPGIETSAVSDGQILSVAGARYRVWISSATDPTHDVSGPQRRRLTDVVLRLAVSLDEEQVEGGLHLDATRVSLPARVYLYMMVLLARYAHADAARGVSPSEVGWRYADDVARALGLDPQALNVQVHRARQDMAKLGFEDPAGLVERRAMTKQMRLGIAADRVIITTL